MSPRTAQPAGSAWADGLEDVAGVGVGHHRRVGRGWLTGCTVVVPPPGTVGSVDVRGGAPGTRETDLLDPRMMVDHVDAICLSGGSAYGLACADGVMAVLEAAGRGHPVGPDGQVVPIVPAAVIFDLGRGGAFGNRPDASFGATAARRALHASGRPAGRRPTFAENGSIGAGTGGRAGGLRGGLGTASTRLPYGVGVAALAVVNAAGSPVDRATGLLLGAAHLARHEQLELRRPSRADVAAAANAMAQLGPTPPRNTTLVVVATDADLSKAECHKLAGVGHDGMARALSPVHLQVDGDVVFSLATGLAPTQAIAFDLLLAAAADVVTRAIVRAVLRATPSPAAPTYFELYPSARR